MDLDKLFLALSDPTRRAILARLVQGEAGATDLAAPFSISQPAVSRHLRVLEEAGLIARRVEGTRRPCRLLPEGVAAAETWLGGLHRGAPAAPAPAMVAEEPPTPAPEKPKKKKKKHRKAAKQA